MIYDVLITAVHDRGDLLERTIRSLLQQVDQLPKRILVHEDVRPLHPHVPGRTETVLNAIERDFSVPFRLITVNPATGLAHAILRLVETATTEFVFFTPEDFDFVRAIPVARCLEIMQRNALHHVRFNKRKTLRIKGEHQPDRRKWWTKQEVVVGDQTFCISDHVYFQAGLTRRALLVDGFREVVSHAGSEPVVYCERRFNDWFNATYGDGAGSVDGFQEKRRELLRTFIWGGVGEPSFAIHTGTMRRTQDLYDPEHDRKHGTVGGVK